MRNIKLTLEYDGTDFYGFQTQPHHRTVQEELETALRKLFQKRIKFINYIQKIKNKYFSIFIINKVTVYLV